MLFRVSGQYATVNRDSGTRIDAVIRALRPWLACGILGVTALAGSAYAQTGATTQSSSTQSSDNSSGALEEIVVTARKREERLIDVPVAVTAVSAATNN
jgi:iron complex outermembrane receptor protein